MSIHSVAMNTTPRQKIKGGGVAVRKFLLKCGMVGIVNSMRARAGGNIWVRLHILLIKQMRKICVIKKMGVIKKNGCNFTFYPGGDARQNWSCSSVIASD